MPNWFLRTLCTLCICFVLFFSFMFVYFSLHYAIYIRKVFDIHDIIYVCICYEHVKCYRYIYTYIWEFSMAILPYLFRLLLLLLLSLMWCVFSFPSNIHRVWSNLRITPGWSTEWDLYCSRDYQYVESFTAMFVYIFGWSRPTSRSSF